MKRDYPRLNIYEFGEALLETEDLDPVYTMLVRSGKDRGWLADWCTSYWCFYHAGFSTFVADRTEVFWAWMSQAARNVQKDFPRGTERRHFRGDKALEAVEWLSNRFPDSLLFLNFLANGKTLRGVLERSGTIPQFGPWIGFKIADMLERVFGYCLDFEEGDVMMYRDPSKAARILWEEEGWGGPTYPGGTSQAYINQQVSKELLGHFSPFRAPPRRDRQVNIQEVETILCKWKSHRNGHYPLGHDTAEIRKALLVPRFKGPSTDLMLRSLP